MGAYVEEGMRRAPFSSLSTANKKCFLSVWIDDGSSRFTPLRDEVVSFAVVAKEVLSR